MLAEPATDLVSKSWHGWNAEIILGVMLAAVDLVPRRGGGSRFFSGMGLTESGDRSMIRGTYRNAVLPCLSTSIVLSPVLGRDGRTKARMVRVLSFAPLGVLKGFPFRDREPDVAGGLIDEATQEETPWHDDDGREGSAC